MKGRNKTTVKSIKSTLKVLPYSCSENLKFMASLIIQCRPHGVLPSKWLYYEHLANLMFEIRHSNAPGNIQDLFQDISDIHSYNTRFLCLK